MILGRRYYERRPRLFLHIPKTGGTWLNDVIIQNGVGFRMLRIKQLKHQTTVADISAIYGPRSRFGFIFRDPVDRLHSAFDSRRNFSRPVRDIPWRPEEATCFAAFETFDDFAAAFDSRASQRRQAAEAALQNIPHFYHGLSYYLGDLNCFYSLRERISMCIETSNLNRALAEVSRIYGTQPLVPTLGARQHSSKAVRTPLSDYGRQVLRTYLHDEYEIYDECLSLQGCLHQSL